MEDRNRWYPTDARVVTGDYFATLGVELLRGDGPEAVHPEAVHPEAVHPEAVHPEGEPVVWINQLLANNVFGDTDPIGHVIVLGGAGRRIVGVVEDVPVDPRGSMSENAYIPHSQYADDRNWALIQVVRARGDLGQLREAVRGELRAVDPELVLYRLRPLADLVAATRAQDRFATTLMTTFALLALALAAVGTYGVLAGSVSRRRREIGIRMALGADPGAVRRMVVGYAFVLLASGAVLGVAGAWAGSRWLGSLLYEIRPGDPLVYAASVTVLALLGAASAWLPARRATRVDPARTLTME